MTDGGPDELKDVAEQVVLDRRWLHQHPELGFEEHETAEYVSRRLEALGIEHRTGVAGTGIVGLIRGGRPGKTVCLRADMDALPILEENDVPYRSWNEGVMHACGHDGHVAILLNAARVLAERRDRLAGDVLLIFQPSEERPPGGGLDMIAAGALDDPKPDVLFNLHLNTRTPAGTMSAVAGPATAATDTFTIEISGTGGHAAWPHLAVDSVLVAAQTVTALHTVVSRNVGPLDAAVVTIGMLQAGTAANVIPATAVLRGTVRTFDLAIRERIERRIRELATGVAQSMGAEASVTYEHGYPPTINDVTATRFVTELARETLGEENVLNEPSVMAGDDLAHFLARVPGCHFSLGGRNEARGLTWGNHHPRFDFDEAALPIGVDLYVRLTERYLGV